MSKMIDLPNKIRNRNVRVVIHDDKLEDVIEDVTIYKMDRWLLVS